MTDDRTILRGLFDAAVEAANPLKGVARNLPPRPKGRTVVIAVGKAADLVVFDGDPLVFDGLGGRVEQVWIDGTRRV